MSSEYSDVTTNACPGPEMLLAALHGEADAAVGSHAAGCAACRARLEELRGLEAVLASSPPERVSGICPPPATFREFLAGRLEAGARQVLEAHAGRCRRCLDVLAAAHDEAVLAGSALPPDLRARLQAMAPLRLPDAAGRPAPAKPRTRRIRFFRLLSPERASLAPALVAASLLLGVAALVVASLSRPARPPRGTAETVRTPPPPGSEEERDAGIDLQIAREQAELRRRQEALEQSERERLRRQAEIEVIEAERRGQEQALRKAVEERRLDEQKRVQEEMRRLDERKQEASRELEKAKENERRRTESLPAVPVIAHLRHVQGQVFAVQGSVRTALQAGAALLSGAGIETAGRFSRASLVYPDGTRVELAPDTLVEELAVVEADGGGKRVKVVRGDLLADVAKQRPGRSMAFATPHARAQVLGTTLRIRVDAAASRLEVTEGKVRMTRLDGRFADVSAGHYAVSAPGIEPAARPLPRAMLADAFEDPRSSDRTWRILLMGKEVSAAIRGGKLDFSKIGGSTAGNVQGEVHTRLAYPAPLRVTVEVEISHAHPNLLAGVTLVPAESEARGDHKDAVLFTLSGLRRSLSVGTGKFAWRGLQNADENAPAPRREEWAVELEGDDARLLVDGRELLRQKHGGRVAGAYHLRMEGTGLAGQGLPPGAYVRYDNVRVEPLTRVAK